MRMESAHFIVYGENGEAKLREAVRTLEMYDAELRHLLNAAPPERANKLEVYLLRNQPRLRQVWPNVTPDVLGFYSASPEEVAAFATYGEGAAIEAQQILFHEYAHHFMLQTASLPYPSWYVEGFAEYVQTITFERDRAVVGDFTQGRAHDILSADWPPIEEFLKPDGARWSAEMHSRFYAESWAATHYLMDDPTRMIHFRDYLHALMTGADPVTAFQPAFGVSPADFERTLHGYARGAIPRMVAPLPTIDVSHLQATPLSRATDDLLLLDACLRRQVGAQTIHDVGARAEEIAQHFPGDPFAQRVRARALMLRGEYAQARAILEALATASPDDIDVQYLLGESYIVEAKATTDAHARAATALQGRRYFTRAFHLNQDHVPTLFGYVETYLLGDAGFPDSAMDVLLRAYDLAPQVSTIGVNAAANLMQRQHYDEAAAMLRPIAFAPHGRSAAA
ncbi:MAG: tetratricopeptide repeat protein, partial [Pseudomonadota bacterium]